MLLPGIGISEHCCEPEDVTNVVSVATGLNFALALRRDGSVAARATTVIHGETNVPPGLDNAVSVLPGPQIAFARLTIIPGMQVRQAAGQVILSWPLSGKAYWLEEATPAQRSIRL